MLIIFIKVSFVVSCVTAEAKKRSDSLLTKDGFASVSTVYLGEKNNGKIKKKESGQVISCQHHKRNILHVLLFFVHYIYI